VAEGRVYITDRLVEPRQVERVHCFEAGSGQTVWSYTYDCLYDGVGYDAGPRATVTVQDGRAYALGSMGYLHVFDAASGELLWHSRLNERFQIDMPVWGIAAAPLVYGQRVILHLGGKDGACVVALAVDSGQEVWRALDDRGSYSAPIITRQAGQDVLVVWTGDHVAGLDPATGHVHWQTPMPPKNMVIGIATPVVDRGQVFVTSFYDGSKMVKLSPDMLTASEAWWLRGRDEKNTLALHSIIATPILRDGYIYGVDSYGELRCLDAASGERIWEDKSATPPDRWSNIHMVQNGDTTWMFNEVGELIIARLTPAGFQEISRAKLIDPTTEQLTRRNRGVCWAHPAYANRCVFARNDQQLVCASLAASD
jgi:outer membrane protein assembly factor BamB